MNDETLRERLMGLILAGVVLIVCLSGYAIGYSNGKIDGSIETEKHYIEIIVGKNYAYLIKQEGKDSFLEYRRVAKVRKCPVIHRDANGNEIDKGGR